MQKNHDQKKQREVKLFSSHTSESPEALYTAIRKKQKAGKEEKVSLPPPRSVEELYTAVKKKNVKGSVMDEEGAPQIPPHRVEDLATKDKEEVPAIPPHTLENFYLYRTML